MVDYHSKSQYKRLKALGLIEKMKQEAEILVKCDYAQVYREYSNQLVIHYIIEDKLPTAEQLDPYADSLQGRRQADAIEDWLRLNNKWAHSNSIREPATGTGQTYHQWRLDRIKWCMKQLEKDDE